MGLVIAFGLVFDSACGAGGGSKAGIAPTGSSGSTKLRLDGGTQAKPLRDGGVSSAAAPAVKILMPKAMQDPNADTILATSMVSVVCQVTRSKVTGSHDVN